MELRASLTALSLLALSPEKINFPSHKKRQHSFLVAFFVDFFCILFGAQKSIDTITVARFWDHFCGFFAFFLERKNR